MTKHVFVIKEQMCQSFWQLVKAFRFEAKKIEGEVHSTPPSYEASRVKRDDYTITKTYEEDSVSCFFLSC